MTIHSLALIWDASADVSSASIRPGPDYSRHTDDQLTAERERRLGHPVPPGPQAPGGSAATTSPATVDPDLERINEELIRRARSRHPSSFHPVARCLGGGGRGDQA